MKNIEIFKALSGLAFAKAYDSFPLKLSISPSELALELGDEYWEESQRQISGNHYGYVRKRSPVGIAKPTIQWLADAGFLSYEKYDGSSFCGVCLTAKGLESIESDESRGKQLLDAVANLAKDELKEQARHQLSELFAGAMSWSIKNVPIIINRLSSLSHN